MSSKLTNSGNYTRPKHRGNLLLQGKFSSIIRIPVHLEILQTHWGNDASQCGK